MRTEAEIQEQFEAFKDLIGNMDIGTFRTLDVDRLVSDYMSGKLERNEEEVPQRESGEVLRVPVWIIVLAVGLWWLL
jgi:hypothetical protein